MENPFASKGYLIILINFYNQLGAGPKNISLNFINYVLANRTEQRMFILVPQHAGYEKLPVSVGNIKIVKLPIFRTIIEKMIYRLYLELILIPRLARDNNIKSMLAFGNFLMAPLKIKKIVLLHHPYLFDNQLFKKLGFKTKLVEGLKRCAFAITLKNVDVVVVQSAYVKSAFSQHWKQYLKPVEVIPNPISDHFPQCLDTSLENLVELRIKSMATLKLLYVSRFNPHKNHTFLLEVSKQLTKRNVNHCIYVTLDNEIPGVKIFMRRTKKAHTHIANIGEIPQSALDEYYKTSHVFIFPSKSETFGNPMIESMKYGLPTLVPDLPYAHAIMGGSGIYYKEDNIVDCIEGIRKVTLSDESYKKATYLSHQQFQQFPTVSEWVNSYIKLMS